MMRISLNLLNVLLCFSVGFILNKSVMPINDQTTILALLIAAIAVNRWDECLKQTERFRRILEELRKENEI